MPNFKLILVNNIDDELGTKNYPLRWVLVSNQTGWGQFSIDGWVFSRRKLIISFFSQNIFAKTSMASQL